MTHNPLEWADCLVEASPEADEDWLNLLAAGLAELEDQVEQSIADSEARAHGENAQLREELAVMRRDLRLLRASFDAARKSHAEIAAKAGVRIAALERSKRETAEEIVGLRKALGELERSCARDRSLRRLTEAKRAYPHADKVKLMEARRRTDKAIAGDAP